MMYWYLWTPDNSMMMIGCKRCLSSVSDLNSLVCLFAPSLRKKKLLYMYEIRKYYKTKLPVYTPSWFNDKTGYTLRIGWIWSNKQGGVENRNSVLRGNLLAAATRALSASHFSQVAQQNVECNTLRAGLLCYRFLAQKHH